MACLLSCVLAMSIGSPAADAPQKYESKNFLLTTDLPKEKAEELLEKLETMLSIISRYWAVPNRRQLECFVVADLKNWPPGSIDPRAMGSIRSGAGITLADYRRRGNAVSIRAVAYAVARTPIVQHEAVHAYSYHAFGTCGPQWYAEGMAEMGAHWVEGETQVTAPRYLTQYLRRAERRSVREITTGETAKVGSWQNYCWRWALCHLLANNKNYARKFRPLGLSMLSKRRGSFSGTYGQDMRELEFEYNFFLDHVEPGFDVGRCSWNWNARFRRMNPEKPVKASVRADQGWQPSRVRVEEGRTYHFETKGTWQIASDGEKLTAKGNGEERNTGCLEAVVMVRRQLRPAFKLGANGKFKARESGDLYLRCQDHWAALNDNSGTMSVTFSIEAEDPPNLIIPPAGTDK